MNVTGITWGGVIVCSTAICRLPKLHLLADHNSLMADQRLKPAHTVPNTLCLGLASTTANPSRSLHSYNGNPDSRQPTINFSHWNCRMGLLESTGEATDKVEEVTNFMTQHNIHVMGHRSCPAWSRLQGQETVSHHNREYKVPYKYPWVHSTTP